LNVIQPKSKLGFNATWSMAVGGMVGGGIFSTLGVVVGIAGAWAWLSFAAAGLIALAAGYSCVNLAIHYVEGGGAFTFLREINAEGFAGSLSRVLIVGYRPPAPKTIAFPVLGLPGPWNLLETPGGFLH
jgi:hypothetical protein